jgi:hypothetical protein
MIRAITALDIGNVTDRQLAPQLKRQEICIWLTFEQWSQQPPNPSIPTLSRPQNGRRYRRCLSAE